MQIQRTNVGPTNLPGAQEAQSPVSGPSAQEGTTQRAGLTSAQKVAPTKTPIAPAADQVSQKVLSRTRELTAQLPQGMQQEMSHLGRNHPDKAYSLLSLSNQLLQGMDASPMTERIQNLQAGLLHGLGQQLGQLNGLGSEGAASTTPSFGLGDVAEEMPEEELETAPNPVENQGSYGAQSGNPQVGPLGPGGPAPGDPLAPTDLVRMMASQVIDVKDQAPSLWNEIKGISQSMQGH